MHILTLYQQVLEVYFRIWHILWFTKKSLHSNYTYIRLEMTKRRTFLPFKVNSKRSHYNINMTCNGVGVILARRCWTLSSCAKQQCVVDLSMSLHCLLKSTRFDQLQWLFLRNMCIFCSRRATFSIALRTERCYRNVRCLLTLNISENIFIRHGWTMGKRVSLCKEQDGMPDGVGKNGICRKKENKSKSIQYEYVSKCAERKCVG